MIPGNKNQLEEITVLMLLLIKPQIYTLILG